MRNKDEIIFGAVYTENKALRFYLPRYYESLNDQKYHYWLPVRVVKEGVDDVYMVDTYQFKVRCEDQRTWRSIISYLKSLGEPKDNRWEMYKNNSYYYTAIVKLDNCSIEAFDLVANLEDYKVVSDDEYRYYEKEDKVYGVKLWNYHNSGKGINIVKNDAKLNYKYKLDNLVYDMFNDIRTPYLWGSTFNKLIDFEKDLMKDKDDYDKKPFNLMKELNAYIENVSKEFDAKISEIRERLKETKEKENEKSNINKF